VRSFRPGSRRTRGPSHRAGGRSRRSRALLGLAASVLLGAGAVAAWAAWSVPSPVELAPPAASTPITAPGPGTTSTSPATVVTSTVSPPVTVSIPSIAVTARVVPEGLGPAGTLDIPPPAQVGWYDHGPAPGQSGTTLLAGHIDDDGVPGALLRLNDVQLGAAIRVTTASGRVAGYTVTRRQLLPQPDLTSSGLLSQQGAPALVLVSCGGAYDAATHLYLDNIVVVATPTR
jgi:Sortase domain